MTERYQQIRHAGSRQVGLVLVPDFYLDTIEDGVIVNSVRLEWSTLVTIDTTHYAPDITEYVVKFLTRNPLVLP